LFGFPLVALEAELGGGEILLPQLGDFVGDPVELAAMVNVFHGEIGHEIEAAGEGHADFDREELGEGVFLGGIEDGVGFLAPVVHAGLGFLEGFPFGESALSPFGHVLFIDGATAEFLVEDFSDFRKQVEPFDEFGSLLAVAETAVEIFADRVGETGDFSVTGHNGR
jgi:hypothetical protein